MQYIARVVCALLSLQACQPTPPPQTSAAPAQPTTVPRLGDCDYAMDFPGPPVRGALPKINRGDSYEYADWNLRYVGFCMCSSPGQELFPDRATKADASHFLRGMLREQGGEAVITSEEFIQNGEFGKELRFAAQLPATITGPIQVNGRVLFGSECILGGVANDTTRVPADQHKKFLGSVRRARAAAPTTPAPDTPRDPQNRGGQRPTLS